MLLGKKLTFRAVAEVFGLAFSAVSMLYITRVVGPEYVGFSATTSAILLLVAKLADSGLSSFASQKLARDDEVLSSLLAIIIPPKLILSTILIVLTLIGARLLDVDPRLKYFVSISVFVVFFDACTPSWVFTSLGRVNISSIIRIGQSILYAASIFIFIHTQADWKLLPYLTLFNSCINFSLATFFLVKHRLCYIDKSIFLDNYTSKLKSYYKESYHFLKAELSGYVFMSSDRLILYYFTNSHVVGIYEAAYKVINPFYAINGVITPTMFRDLAQSYKQGKLYPVMAKYVFIMSILTIPLGFFMLYFSGFTVQLLFGSKFAETIPCLMILGFVITFGFTSGIIAQPFCVWNMQKEFGNSVFFGNVINTVLNFTLIPFMGAIGAALATLAAKLIVTVVGYFYFKKVTDYPIVKDFVYFFIASIIPLLFVYGVSLINKNNIVLIITYGTTYVLLLIIMYMKYFKINLKPA